MEDKAIVTTQGGSSLFDFGSNIERAFKFSEVLARSEIIPDSFRGNPASCLIALDMAVRLRRNPLEVMQAMYIVHGKPSFSSSFLIAIINSSGFYEPLRFRFSGEGDKRSCIAWTVDKRTGETVEGPEISIAMAKAENWFDKSGSKWKTMPEVMLRYRAAAFFQRAYCPDLIGGFHSDDEIRDGAYTIESEDRNQNISLEEKLTKKAIPEQTAAHPEVKPEPKPEKEPEDKPREEAKARTKTKTPEPKQEQEDGGDFPLPEPVNTATDSGKSSVADLIGNAKKEGFLNFDNASEDKRLSNVEKLRLKLEELLGPAGLDLTAKEGVEWLYKRTGAQEIKKLSTEDLSKTIAIAQSEIKKREM